MLTRVISVGGLIVLMTGLVLAGGLPAARASGPGGSPFGGVTCGQGYTPGCTVMAGTTGTSAAGTAGSTTGGSRPDGSTLAAGGGSGGEPGCAGTVSKTFGCAAPGCAITAQTLACPAGAPAPAAPAGGRRAPAPPPPAVLAQLAERYLRLPGPVIRSSPAPGTLQLTWLPTWLWVVPAAWQPVSETAQVPGESVTATATPVSAAWSMGNGAVVTCHGPGTAFTAGDNPAAASPTCGYTYEESSAGQPGGAYQVTVTITWDIAWKGTDGAGGALPALETVAAAEFRVAESQALNTGSGG
jgi:hypothetical protein